MTRNEAIECVTYLMGLFATMTPEQCRLMRDEFERFDKTPVRRAIEAHAKQRDFLNIPQLREGILAQSTGLTPAQVAQRQRERQWARGLDEVEQLIARMTDQDLITQQAALVREYEVFGNRFVAARVRGLNPRTSRWLKNLIANRVRSHARDAA